MGLLERWDRRNQRWADQVTATPPPDRDFSPELALVFIPLTPVAVVVAGVLAVRRRRREQAAGAISGRC